jgi:serine/threonine-protein kinase
LGACVICQTEIRDDARFCPSCGAEQPAQSDADGSDDPFIGQKVAGNFRIESLLGVGGMGKVYKARQLSLDKAVVIKILHDHFKDDPQLVQRFQREARAASRLNHPNSIQVIDFGQDQGETKVLYMAIEYLEGVDLFSVLKNQGPLNTERICRVMVQVCSALAEAHEANVIHRDLKPENIMVEDRRGQKDFVKVLDFGIAKIQDPDDQGGQALTQAGMVCGTPEYMSPEQARGQSLDNRSDLYSLGVLVYQLVTGQLPFNADSPIGIVTKHIIEQPVPPSQVAPQLNIDPRLEAIILKSMAKEATERYQTAAEMGEAFEALLYNRTPAPAAVPPVATTPTEPAGQAAPTGAGTMVGAAAANPTGAGAQAAQPTSPANTGAQPTTTSPTPTGVSPAPKVVTHPELDEVAVPSGGGMKWAALAGVAVLLVAGGAAFALLGGDETADPPKDDPPVAANDDKPKPDDTNKPPEDGTPKPDDGTAAGGTDTATRTPTEAVAQTGGTKTPKPKDKGDTRVATTTKTPKDDGAATPPPAPATPKVPASKRAKAKQLVVDANKALAGGDKDGAYTMLMDAYKMDPSNPAPLKSIAMIHRMAGRKDQACNAMKTFVMRKGGSISKDQAGTLLKTTCPKDQLPEGLR